MLELGKKKSSTLSSKKTEQSGVQIVYVPDPEWDQLPLSLTSLLKTMRVPVTDPPIVVDTPVSGFLQALNKATKNPAMVVLISHASEDGFGPQDGSFSIEWPKFAKILDVSSSRKAVILLGCETGRGSVAKKIFEFSKTAVAVVGSPKPRPMHDLILACHMFFYSIAANKFVGEHTINLINNYLGQEVLRDYTRGHWKVELYTAFGL